MRYVIIGGGIAGTTAAEEIRKIDKDAEIILIGEEQHPLYSKVLLSHYVLEKIEREKVYIKKGSWYREKNIEYQYGVIVTKIDTKNQFVETSEGREVPYDKLLITTGGEPRLIVEDLRGVSYFRTLDDADQIMAQMAELKVVPDEERKAVVLGGAFIALEYINLLHHHKISTTVVMRSDGFWSKIIGSHAKKIIKAHVESEGVEIITGTGVDHLEGKFELKAVKLTNGEMLQTKMLGVGIGLEIDQRLYEDAGIGIETGILADEFLETNVKNVYTAGDIAEFNDVRVGRHIMARNWTNGFMQGRVAAQNMTGEKNVFDVVSSYAAEMLGLDIVFVGDTVRGEADEIVQHVADDQNSIEIFNRGGATVGAVIVGSVKERQAITTAIINKENYVA